MSSDNKFEQQFFSKLNDVFVGAKIEGDSGFINLMKIKSRYYEQGVFPQLKKDIDTNLQSFPEFREELFQKLYNFFSRYFSESGSIYFRFTPPHEHVYEKVYTDDRDVMLFWKTHMLYYVKTDRVFQSIEVELDEYKFAFDVSKLVHKKSNEKRMLVFEYSGKRPDGGLKFTVTYSERGRKTSVADIRSLLRSDGITLGEDTLDHAFRLFERQSEVDYFINKDARAFLREQFDLWLYQYVFEPDKDKPTLWTEIRLAQIQALRSIAYNIIEFIAQFEDELVRIWTKPKFVLNSHYVITLDRITESLLNKLLKHKGMLTQVQEWQALGMVDKEFDIEVLARGSASEDIGIYRHLPIDTRYFVDLEIEILSQFEDIDKSLDGWLIQSENFQALNTILPKFRGKLQCIYIDPPFNTGDDFPYLDNYQDSTWITLMRDRIDLCHQFLNETGTFWLHLDDNANMLGKQLLKNVYPVVSEIIFDTNATKDEEADLFGYKSFGDNFQLKHQTIFYCRQEKYFFRKLWKPNRNTTSLSIGWLDLLAIPRSTNPKKINDFQFAIEAWDKDRLVLKEVDIDEKVFPVGDIWTDIFSFTQSEMRVSESLSFTSSQKPENLLRRIIQSSTNPKDFVLDCFLGIGTTSATAHKLGRKWIGIEMGAHFNEWYETEDGRKLGVMGRMKWVVNGDRSVSLPSVDRRPHLTKDINWQGGGFFKYMQIEQYDDALRTASYQDADMFDNPNENPYSTYVFLRDKKLLDNGETGQSVMVADTESGMVSVHLDRLYSSVDLAETYSCVTGKWIKRIAAEEVEFEDGSVLSLIEPDWDTLRPLIWW